jgi:hypothetical protein
MITPSTEAAALTGNASWAYEEPTKLIASKVLTKKRMAWGFMNNSFLKCRSNLNS